MTDDVENALCNGQLMHCPGYYTPSRAEFKIERGHLQSDLSVVVGLQKGGCRGTWFTAVGELPPTGGASSDSISADPTHSEWAGTPCVSRRISRRVLGNAAESTVCISRVLGRGTDNARVEEWPHTALSSSDIWIVKCLAAESIEKACISSRRCHSERKPSRNAFRYSAQRRLFISGDMWYNNR